jgi:hypothetical protein
VMNVLGALHCTYDDHGEHGLMARMPTQPCWRGHHWHFVGVAVPILLVIYPLMISFERKARRHALRCHTALLRRTPAPRLRPLR